MNKFLSRLLLGIFLAGFLLPSSGFAQGNPAPTGPAGMFGINSTTGCSYNPYTANAQRIIPDLTVAGAVGAYPLQWTRIMNSRLSGNSVFGLAGGWRHSYQWSCSCEPDSSLGAPLWYSVAYPDGRTVTFSAGANAPYLPPTGVTDRFTPFFGTGTGYVYLNLTDGGTVRFSQTTIYHRPIGGDPGWYEYTINGPPDQITDPHGNVTTLTYTSTNLTRVTGPGGRYLTISYGTNGYVSRVDSYTAALHATQWVQYSYQTQTIGTWSGVVLTGATYIGSPVPTASYTYQTSNLSTGGTPLISTCQDVRYPGPMKNIKYAFVRTSPLSYGELSQEQDINGTPVLTLSVNTVNNTRTETRGDGTNAVRSGVPTRVFTYGATAGGVTKDYLLKSVTDFKGQLTTLAYDVDGFMSSRTTSGHTTSFTYLTNPYPTGVITKITHPGDGSSIQYSYTDGTGAYLYTMTDELGHTTTYKRYQDGTNNVSEIDYLDGGIEKYTYNTFGQVLTHTLPSIDGTLGASTDSEKYSYDSTGLLLTYTPPATASDPAPSPHPTRYTYDINDHLSTITDPKGNVTTQYHNELGQLTIEYHDDADNSYNGYTYNTDGTLQKVDVQLTAAIWASTSYAYDDYKRLISVVDPMINETDYSYDVNGAVGTGLGHTDANVTRLTLPSGKVTQTLYDENLRKGQLIVGQGTSDAAKTTYTYDAAGNLKTVIDPKGQTSGATWTYNYDARDRLINVVDPLAADRNSNGHTVDYTYDWANNKLTETRANNQVITYNSYDERNRLLQMTVQQAPTADAVTTYTWSNAGKMLSMVDPKLHTYSYAYDRLNRLGTVT